MVLSGAIASAQQPPVPGPYAYYPYQGYYGHGGQGGQPYFNPSAYYGFNYPYYDPNVPMYFYAKKYVESTTPPLPASVDLLPHKKAARSRDALPIMDHRPIREKVIKAPKAPIEFHRCHKEVMWVTADYSMNWIRAARVGIPLVTTGSTLDPSPGAMGQAGTVLLLGNAPIDYGMFQGVRGETGLFLDEENQFSMDIGGFYLFPRRYRASFASNAAGSPLLTRPTINAATDTEQAYIVSFPGLGAGNVAFDMRSQLFGGEVNGRIHGYWLGRLHVEGLAGFRALRFEESLRLHDQVNPITDNVFTFMGTFVNSPNILETQDYFRAYNQFYGFQLGGKMRWEHDWFFIDLLGKVAMGVTSQRMNILGSTALITPTGTSYAAGGILAVPSNMAEHNRHDFGVVPEIGINLGLEVTRNLRLRSGYSFLMWNSVIRPGDHLDRTVNPAIVPSDQDFGNVAGPTRPAFSFHEQVFWAHAFNFGLEVHY